MTLKKDVEQLISQVAHLIWPARCCACSKRFSPKSYRPIDAAFCPICQDTTLAILQSHCPVCTIPLNTEHEAHLCGECLTSRPAFDKLLSVYEYGAAVADAISRLKYGKNTALARPLGAIMADRARVLGPVGLVVPVPLHPKKLRVRGFNQATLLANVIARELHTKSAPLLLKRLIDTPPQSRLCRKQRLSNMTRAFGATTPSKGETVLLIDDVATTCATLEAATLALHKAGFKKITCLTLARASG